RFAAARGVRYSGADDHGRAPRRMDPGLHPVYLAADQLHRALHSFPTRRSSDLLHRRMDDLADRSATELARLVTSREVSPDVTSRDPKSTRLNPSHVLMLEFTFCLQ